MKDMLRILKIRGFTPHIVRNLTVVCLFVIFLMGQVGCAAKTPPPRLAPETRAQFGTIAVVPARFAPEADLLTPAKGALRGTGRGLGAGYKATEGLENLVPTSGDGLAGLVIGTGVLAIVATSTLIGGVYGAVAAEPKATVEELEAVLKKAMAAMEVQKALGANIVEYGQAEMRYAFRLLLDQGPRSAKSEVDYRPLSGYGVDTLLQVNVLKFGLQGEQSVNPPLHLIMAVQTKLIRDADSTSLYERTFDYSSEDHKFTEWAANDAQLFRATVAGAYREVSEDIVIELLLPYDLPGQTQPDEVR
jgi:hypothetical protein